MNNAPMNDDAAVVSSSSSSFSASTTASASDSASTSTSASIANDGFYRHRDTAPSQRSTVLGIGSLPRPLAIYKLFPLLADDSAMALFFTCHSLYENWLPKYTVKNLMYFEELDDVEDDTMKWFRLSSQAPMPIITRLNVDMKLSNKDRKAVEKSTISTTELATNLLQNIVKRVQNTRLVLDNLREVDFHMSEFAPLEAFPVDIFPPALHSLSFCRFYDREIDISTLRLPSTLKVLDLRLDWTRRLKLNVAFPPTLEELRCVAEVVELDLKTLPAGLKKLVLPSVDGECFWRCQDLAEVFPSSIAWVEISCISAPSHADRMNRLLCEQFPRSREVFLNLGVMPVPGIDWSRISPAIRKLQILGKLEWEEIRMLPNTLEELEVEVPKKFHGVESKDMEAGMMNQSTSPFPSSLTRLKVTSFKTTQNDVFPTNLRELHLDMGGWFIDPFIPSYTFVNSTSLEKLTIKLGYVDARWTIDKFPPNLKVFEAISVHFAKDYRATFPVALETLIVNGIPSDLDPFKPGMLPSKLKRLEIYDDNPFREYHVEELDELIWHFSEYLPQLPNSLRTLRLTNGYRGEELSALPLNLKDIYITIPIGAGENDLSYICNEEVMRDDVTIHLIQSDGFPVDSSWFVRDLKDPIFGEKKSDSDID